MKNNLGFDYAGEKKYESLAKAPPHTSGARSAARGDTSCQIIQSTIVHIERCEYRGTNKFIYCNVECTPYRVDNKTVHIFCRSDSYLKLIFSEKATQFCEISKI